MIINDWKGYNRGTVCLEKSEKRHIQKIVNPLLSLMYTSCVPSALTTVLNRIEWFSTNDWRT